MFPTTLRGMAICINGLFSRLGAVIGSIITAYLLDKCCESAFYISGISLIGKYHCEISSQRELNLNNYFLLILILFFFSRNAGVGILTYFIPKIHEKHNNRENIAIRSRASIISYHWWPGYLKTNKVDSLRLLEINVKNTVRRTLNCLIFPHRLKRERTQNRRRRNADIIMSEAQTLNVCKHTKNLTSNVSRT